MQVYRGRRVRPAAEISAARERLRVERLRSYHDLPEFFDELEITEGGER